jgi:hypothetical protein
MRWFVKDEIMYVRPRRGSALRHYVFIRLHPELVGDRRHLAYSIRDLRKWLLNPRSVPAS